MATEKKVKGFGDEIAKVTKKLGLDQVADNIAKAAGKKDCGCKKRQKQLNNPDLLVNKIFYGKNKVKENEK